MIKGIIFSELGINYFSHNISSSLTIFTCRFGIPIAEPAARIHSTEVAVWRCNGCVCMQMFSQAYCIYEITRAKSKIKDLSPSPPPMSAHASTYSCVHTCVASVCVLECVT